MGNCNTKKKDKDERAPKGLEPLRQSDAEKQAMSKSVPPPDAKCQVNIGLPEGSGSPKNTQLSHMVSPISSARPLAKSLLPPEIAMVVPLDITLCREFMDACFTGNELKIDRLVANKPISFGRDMSTMKGFRLLNGTSAIIIGKGPIKKSYDLSEWNPILLAIAGGHIHVLKKLFDIDPTSSSFHKMNSISKPYSDTK